jgi:DNA replication protein DnaC
MGWTRSDAPIGHPDFGRMVRCQCQAANDAARLQRLSGLSEREQIIRLSDIDITCGLGTRNMVAVLREFVRAPVSIVTIHGTPGNAKTVGLQAAVNELRLLGIEAVYVTLFDLISYIREAFNATDRTIKSDSAYDRLVRWETVRVLALDEFDKVKHQTDWVLDQVTDLIDKRYRTGMDGTTGTLIAMNDSPYDLPVWIASRLQDDLNQVVENMDPDMRSSGGKQ